MTTLHTAGGGIELLIWVAFIIISMIAQASKGAKKHKQNRPTLDPSAAPRPHLDPQKELEEFLESLSRGRSISAPETPEPAPTPIAPRPVTTAPSVDRSPRPAPTPPALPQVFMPEPPPVVRHVTHVAPRPAPVPVPTQPRAAKVEKRYVTVDLEDAETAYYRKLRDEIRGDLHDQHNLRKAVLLQEILNPPIALRTGKH